MEKKAKRAVASILKNSTTAKKVANKKSAAVKPVAKKPAALPKAASAPAAKKAVPSPVKKKSLPSASVKKAASSPRKALPGVPVKKGLVRKLREEPLRKIKFSKAEKKYYYDLLMTVRAAFGEQIKFHSDEVLSSHKDSAGERAGMATHMADLGTDNFRHDFELGLMSEEVDVLEMVDEALQRLEDSEYGICLDCGATIPRERLEAKPYAKYCTRCKSRREEMDNTRR